MQQISSNFLNDYMLWAAIYDAAARTQSAKKTATQSHPATPQKEQKQLTQVNLPMYRETSMLNQGAVRFKY